MKEVIQTPLFGIVVSFFFFRIAQKIQERFKSPLLNPLVLSTVFIIIFLTITNISFKDYYRGGEFLNMIIAPATVALAIPLYQYLDLLKQNVRPILVGVLFGTFFTTIITGILGIVFALAPELTVSILPHTVTTAIAIGISSQAEGIEVMTIISVIFTGSMGAMFAPTIFKHLNITDPIAKGIALGTTSHAIGTAKAVEIGEIEGATSSLAISLSGIAMVGIVPLVINILSFWM